MRLTQKTIIKEPTLCYVVFGGLSFNNPYNNPYYSDDDPYIDGNVEIFKSLNELNNYLLNKKIENMEDISLNNVYKGYLFPATHFPLETVNEYKNATIFILEIVSDVNCFVEQVKNLELAAETIQDEVNAISNIENYMVFEGKPVSLSFYYDEDEDKEED